MNATDILILVGRLNLAASAAILLVFAIRPLARPRLGGRLTYAFWLLPLIAMVAALAPARQVLAPAQVLVLSQPAVAGWSDFAVGHPVVGDQAIPLDAAIIALVLWLAGTLIAGLFTACLQRRFLAEAMIGGIGPAVIGVISPRVVTPSDFTERFDAEERVLILAHEQVHIRRHDLRLNAFATALQCIFWFNPLIHLANRQMRFDQELACDEAVVSRFPDSRNVYVRALVKSQLTSQALPFGCYWPSRKAHPFFERIAMIRTVEFIPHRRIIGGGALGLIALVTGYTVWAAQPAQVMTQPAIAQPAHAAPSESAPRRTEDAARPRIGETSTSLSQDELCLTNACGSEAMSSMIGYERDEAAVAAALRARHAGNLVRAGGTPDEVLDILLATCGQPGRRACDQLPPRGTPVRFERTPGGAIAIAASYEGPVPWSPNSNSPPMVGQDHVSGFVVFEDPDLAALAAPDSVPDDRVQLPQEIARAKPLESEELQPDGTVRRRVTGYELSTGEVITPEEFMSRIQALARNRNP